jgi:hypothetical protein
MSDIDLPMIQSRSRLRFSLALWVSAIMCCTGLTACQSSRTASSPTGGLQITMYVRDATSAESYFEVDRSGTLGFGGGVKARLFQPTWSGPMMPEEIQQLRALLEAQDWFREKPGSTDQPPEQVYRVTIDAPQRRTQFKVNGENQALAAIHQMLAKAALRRLEPTLRSLPEPNIRQSTTQPATQPSS